MGVRSLVLQTALHDNGYNNAKQAGTNVRHVKAGWHRNGTYGTYLHKQSESYGDSAGLHRSASYYVQTDGCLSSLIWVSLLAYTRDLGISQIYPPRGDRATGLRADEGGGGMNEGSREGGW